jgi:hypothetical protein
MRYVALLTPKSPKGDLCLANGYNIVIQIGYLL